MSHSPLLASPSPPDTGPRGHHRLRLAELHQASLWATIRILLLALLFGAAVYASNIIIDRMVLIHTEGTRVTIDVSDAVAALIATALFFTLLRNERERRRAVARKLATIEEMNHHIRNALQIIVLQAHTSFDKAQFEAINDALDRIQWALREVLPKV